MRAACRKFLDTVQASDRYDIIRLATHAGHHASWVFIGALGEMRGVFGVHLMQLAAIRARQIGGQSRSMKYFG